MQTSPAQPQLQPPPAQPAQPEATTADPAANQLNALSLSALKSRQADLMAQLASVAARRAELAHDLRRTNSLAQDGILQHIKQLDARSTQIEFDLAANSKAILLKNASESHAPRNFDFGNGLISQGAMIPITIVFTIFVLCPIALSISRLLWKRGNRAPVSVASRASELRMERVEQAVDAIAVEIERISEGQRFVTQLLSKPVPNALSVGLNAAEPMRIPVAEAVPVGATRAAG